MTKYTTSHQEYTYKTTHKTCIHKEPLDTVPYITLDKQNSTSGRVLHSTEEALKSTFVFMAHGDKIYICLEFTSPHPYEKECVCSAMKLINLNL